jgi:hypothetical protein
MAAGTKEQKEIASAPAPAVEPVRMSRADAVRAQAQAAQDPRERYTLAPALEGTAEWHKCPDGGFVGITRAETQQGEQKVVRDFVTFIPPRGRVSGIPLYALDAHPELDV